MLVYEASRSGVSPQATRMSPAGQIEILRIGFDNDKIDWKSIKRPAVRRPNSR